LSRWGGNKLSWDPGDEQNRITPGRTKRKGVERAEKTMLLTKATLEGSVRRGSLYLSTEGEGLRNGEKIDIGDIVSRQGLRGQTDDATAQRLSAAG